MLLAAAGLVIGIVALVWSADRFVIGASATASLLGVSPLVVGILVVGIGTSAPEMLVSGIAAWDGQTGLSVGNALGSNITNIGLVLGFTALLIPLKVQSKIISRELPLLLGVMLVGAALLWDGHLGLTDGLILFAGFAGVIVRQLLEAKNHRDDILAAEYAAHSDTMSMGLALINLFGGLLLLVVSARLLVWAAVVIAQSLGVSDLVIGLTVVAIGTSLPELAASIAAARKDEHDIAIGNVIGSNLFNLLGVMALPGVIRPAPLDPAVALRDYPVMLALTVLLLLFAWQPNGSGTGARTINRLEGAVLLSAYIAYMLWLGFRG